MLLLTELVKKLLNYPMFTKGKDDPVQLFHNNFKLAETESLMDTK